jgi:pyrimidine-nucleoside phosphorylase
MSMDLRPIIAVRRDGGVHSAQELMELAKAAAEGSVPDYQLSAWLMAAYLNPLSEAETVDLTLAMAASGTRLDLSRLPRPWLDKHSTGGVGDKTTLVVLPILAACGLSIVKMSGRGLGVTGGTIDKLHAIPGFRTELTPEELLSQAARVRIALGGQTAELAPADGVLYALRDVTGTTASLPLIVSSILSKKLASGAESVVIDVKWGTGAFMTTKVAAIELGEWLIRVGRRCGLRVAAVLSGMNEPLGSAVGNSLEVDEALRVLRGENTGPIRATREVALAVASLGLQISKFSASAEEADGRVVAALDSGAALEKADAWISAQGGTLPVPVAPTRQVVCSLQSGWIAGFDAARVAEVVLNLGGGRKQKGDEIDATVGVIRSVSVGDRIEQGDVLGEIHAASELQVSAAKEALLRAVKISPTFVDRPVHWERLEA